MEYIFIWDMPQFNWTHWEISPLRMGFSLLLVVKINHEAGIAVFNFTLVVIATF
jgi:hypothetical protein